MSNENKSIIRLRPDPQGFGDTPDELEAAEFSSAVPVQHSFEAFEDDDIGLYVGVWDTESMVEAGGPYACDEFMWLLEGECQIKNNRSGEIETVRAGTAFVIPKGYDCQWHQQGYLRKFYVISEHPDEPIPASPSHEGIVVPNAGDKPGRNICYEDVTGRFLAGTWVCSDYESQLHPSPHTEFGVVEAGSITLTDAAGRAEIFNASDAFLIPQGVECQTSVSHEVRLIFAVVKQG